MDNVEPIKIADMYNNGMTLKEIGEQFGVSKSTIQRVLAKGGFVRNNETGKYAITVSDKTNVLHETSINDTNVSNETINLEKLVNRTYAISEKIDRALKIKSAVEGKKSVDVVRDALKAYIEDKYFDM